MRDDPLSAFRGICLGVLLGAFCWAVFVFVLLALPLAVAGVSLASVGGLALWRWGW